MGRSSALGPAGRLLAPACPPPTRPARPFRSARHPDPPAPRDGARRRALPIEHGELSARIRATRAQSYWPASSRRPTRRFTCCAGLGHAGASTESNAARASTARPSASIGRLKDLEELIADAEGRADAAGWKRSVASKRRSSVKSPGRSGSAVARPGRLHHRACARQRAAPPERRPGARRRSKPELGPGSAAPCAPERIVHSSKRMI